jgi:hypothetical protein
MALRFALGLGLALAEGKAKGAPLAAAVPDPTAALAALPALLPPGQPRPVPATLAPAWLLWLILTPPGLTWLVLATQRAWRDDPLRERRRARRALQRLIAGWRRRPPSRLDLETWRDLCVRAWGLRLAVPSAAEFAAGIPAEAKPAAWSALWTEAEHALFANRPALPADWPTRAMASSAALPRLAVAPRLPLRGRAWWPALAAWLCASLAAPTTSAATATAAAAAAPAERHARGAAADYQAGRFVPARQEWLEQIARSPGDWAAHHNAGLTFAREERWGPAAGHWTAAFLLHPSDPAVAAAFRLGLSKLDGAEPVLRQLASRSGYHRVAALASVAQWQETLFAGAAALALGLTALLAFAYCVRSPRPRRGALGSAAGLAAAGALLLALSGLALRQYGPLVEPRSAFVVNRAQLRAIPSDIVGREATSALPSGTVVMVNRSFLGWDQVSVNGGVVGWVRTDTLLWLYRHRDTSVAATLQPP